MAQICETCGLPKEICACTSIEKETSGEIRVFTKKERYNFVTIITGLKSDEVKSVAKELKQKLACGGTFKENNIILQGDHKEKVAEFLVKAGYPKEFIKVS